MPAPLIRRSLVVVPPFVLLALGCGGQDGARTTTVAASIAVDTTRPSAPPIAPATAPESAAPKLATYQDAAAAYDAGRYVEAADLFGAYVTRKPENPWGFYMLGLSSWKAGDLAQADVAFDEALKLDPKHQKSLINSTRVLLELGRSDEALDRIHSAIELDSTSAEAWRVLGRALAELGDPDEAIDADRHAIALDDRDAWAMNNLGLIYIRQGRFADALPPLARATQLRPGAPVFQNNLGQALEASGYVAEAEQAYQAAVTADSTYQKAALALERVAGRGQDSTVATVDVVALARGFQTTIEQWRDEFAAAAEARDEDPATGMVRDSTPDVVTRPDPET